MHGAKGSREVADDHHPRHTRGRRVRQHLRQRVYLLPGAFTVGNMLLGFLAIIQGLKDHFDQAVLLLFCAAVLDSLDGRIARLTNTQSEFGKEYDSLADIVTFGVAPALLSYLWGLEESGHHAFGRAGWLFPAFYMVCAATRLARFNVQIRTVDSRYFVGLPSPAAAGGVAALLFTLPSFNTLEGDTRTAVGALLLGAVGLLGALMVSTFRYQSFKKFNLHRWGSYRMMLPITLVLLLAAYQPTKFFVGVAVVYTLSGPAAWLWGRLRRRSAADAGPDPDATSTDSPQEPTP